MYMGAASGEAGSTAATTAGTAAGTTSAGLVVHPPVNAAAPTITAIVLIIRSLISAVLNRRTGAGFLLL
jgi:hypothetical protein